MKRILMHCAKTAKGSAAGRHGPAQSGCQDPCGSSPTRGFTLVELLVAMVAGSILILSVGSMLLFGYRGWSRNSANVDMQLDGAAVMKTINRYVREASATNITIPTGSGSITIRTTNATVRVYQSGANLVFDPNTAVGGNEMNMVRGRLANFAPSWQTNRVAVTLILNQGNESVSLASATTFRN